LPLMDGEQVVEKQPDQTMLTRRYVERSVEFVRDNVDRPFFLYFAHMHVHLPLYVEDTFHGDSRNGPYGAAVHAIDWATGVLLDELDALGLADDTIVIFTSDNGALARPGEGSNAPLRGTKAQTTEGGMRVPAIIRWPGVVPAGVTHDELTTAMDLLPTLARWAGTSVPDDVVIDGHDITDVVIDGRGIRPSRPRVATPDVCHAPCLRSEHDDPGRDHAVRRRCPPRTGSRDRPAEGRRPAPSGVGRRLVQPDGYRGSPSARPRWRDRRRHLPHSVPARRTPRGRSGRRHRTAASLHPSARRRSASGARRRAGPFRRGRLPPGYRALARARTPDPVRGGSRWA
ncbi:MAG: hypothetical protein EBY49_08480, partial [Actinobacteria bacterium]|nr:hypothetical protein [Actinomycetota bacterium]